MTVPQRMNQLGNEIPDYPSIHEWLCKNYPEFPHMSTHLENDFVWKLMDLDVAPKPIHACRKWMNDNGFNIYKEWTNQQKVLFKLRWS